MKLALALFCLIATQAFACDLTFPQYGVCGTVRWTQGPVLRTESTLEIVLAPGIPNLVVKVDAFMPQHGHGTRPVEMKTREDGVIEVSKLYFVMAGAWVLRVMITDDSNFPELAQLPVEL